MCHLNVNFLSYSPITFETKTNTISTKTPLTIVGVIGQDGQRIPAVVPDEVDECCALHGIRRHHPQQILVELAATEGGIGGTGRYHRYVEALAHGIRCLNGRGGQWSYDSRHALVQLITDCDNPSNLFIYHLCTKVG